jgi:hypothetical protein
MNGSEQLIKAYYWWYLCKLFNIITIGWANKSDGERMYEKERKKVKARQFKKQIKRLLSEFLRDITLVIRKCRFMLFGKD